MWCVHVNHGCCVPVMNSFISFFCGKIVRYLFSAWVPALILWAYFSNDFFFQLFLVFFVRMVEFKSISWTFFDKIEKLKTNFTCFWKKNHNFEFSQFLFLIFNLHKNFGSNLCCFWMFNQLVFLIFFYVGNWFFELNQFFNYFSETFLQRLKISVLRFLVHIVLKSCYLNRKTKTK